MPRIGLPSAQAGSHPQFHGLLVAVLHWAAHLTQGRFIYFWRGVLARAAACFGCCLSLRWLAGRRRGCFLVRRADAKSPPPGCCGVVPSAPVPLRGGITRKRCWVSSQAHLLGVLHHHISDIGHKISVRGGEESSRQSFDGRFRRDGQSARALPESRGACGSKFIPGSLACKRS